MKFAMSAVVCLLAGVLLSAEAPKQKKMTLEEAKEKIAEIVKTPEKMGEITSQLSAEDQKAFMVEVNKAIAVLPGSNESRTAVFIAVEREALLAAEKGNLQPMVATMFASMPLESLTVTAERFGEDLFNNGTGEEKKFTDEQFTEIASSTVGEVAKACEGLSDAAPRNTLAVYLFEKASNGTIEDLEDKLLEIAIPDSQTRETAKSEWLAAANREGSSGFAAMLASAEAGRVPNAEATMKIAGPQVATDALTELGSESETEAESAIRPDVDVPIAKDAAQAGTAIQADQAQKVTNESGQQIMPQTKGENTTGRETSTANQAAQTVSSAAETQPKTNAEVPYNPSYSREQVKEEKKEPVVPEPEPEPEPKPYQYQD